jgi:hypothetical protein
MVVCLVASYRPDWNCSTIRGGVLLMLISALWIPFARNGEIRAMDWFMWAAGLWMVFPMGAFLGGYLMPRLNPRSLPLAIAMGLGFGLLSGVLLTLLMVGLLKADALIGLITNANGGGYESYRFSVLKDLREMTWSIGKGIVPVLTFTLLVLAIVNHRRGRKNFPTGTDMKSAARLSLRLSGWHVVWWLGVAVIPASLSGMMIATQNGGIGQTFLWVCGGAGLTVIGPMIGPVINSNSGNPVASWGLLIALPILVLSLLPFLLKRSVSRRAAIFYWCIYITVVLAWTCLGIFSAGMCMG